MTNTDLKKRIKATGQTIGLEGRRLFIRICGALCSMAPSKSHEETKQHS